MSSRELVLARFRANSYSRVFARTRTDVFIESIPLLYSANSYLCKGLEQLLIRARTRTRAYKNVTCVSPNARR